jgi:hypothetical protein
MVLYKKKAKGIHSPYTYKYNYRYCSTSWSKKDDPFAHTLPQSNTHTDPTHVLEILRCSPAYAYAA